LTRPVQSDRSSAFHNVKQESSTCIENGYLMGLLPLFYAFVTG
jgi:hypothetical protein